MFHKDDVLDLILMVLFISPSGTETVTDAWTVRVPLVVPVLRLASALQLALVLVVLASRLMRMFRGYECVQQELLMGMINEWRCWFMVIDCCVYAYMLTHLYAHTLLQHAARNTTHTQTYNARHTAPHAIYSIHHARMP